MAFGRDKIKNDLKKAIYKAIAKAYKQNIPFVKEAVDGVNKEHAVNHIIADLEDDNNVAQVPENHIPVDKDSVLHKDIPSVKEMHDAKEAQAKAKLGVTPLAGQKGAINMSETPSNGVQKLKKFMGDRQMAKTSRHEKGVHHPVPRDNKDSGESLTGHYARKGDSLAHISDYESGKEVANSLHNEKLAEIKKMPKPNLPKSEEMDKAREDELVHPSQRQKFREEKRKMEGRDVLQDQLTSSKGVSDVGIEVRRADKRKPGVISHGYARIAEPEQHATRAKKYLQGMHQRIKDMPKPNLPKSEEMDKARVDEGMTSKAKLQARWDRAGDQTKGVHTAPFKSVPGMSTSRYEIESTGRPTDVARASHKKVLSDIKSMPKPNLGKAEYPRSEHQKIYDAKTQAAQEAYLKTPEGEKQRQIDNQKRIDAQKVKKAESKHDRCVESVEQSSPEVENPHAVCVARGVTPRKWKK